MNSERRKLARTLRAEHGMSLREIASRVGASLSTVSLWVRDVRLSADQEAALLARNPARNAQTLGARNNAVRRRDARAAAQEHGRELARGGDLDFVGGCMLYWAEGSKRRNDATLTNADPDLLAAFLRFLRRCYAVGDEQVAFSVNCFTGNGLDVDEIERWWLDRLDLPASSLRKASVNRPSATSQGKRRTLLYGTGRVAVHSTFVVQSIYGGIQEIAGIERPEWLDL